MEKSKIFISHRHSDTQSDCHRLKADLEDKFGKENVFLDIENLEPGINFADAIRKTISQSKVVLVVIGPNWQGPEDENGVTRLFQPNDWVRSEVAAALLSEDTRVIPVLVKNATEPKESNLPEDLKPLAGLQATEITIKRWDYDVGELIKVLEKLVPPKKIKPDPFKPFNPPKPKSWWAKNYLWVLGIFVVVIIIASWPTEDYLEDYVDPGPHNNNIINNPPGESPPQTGIDVGGNWILYLEGEAGSTFVMSQYPEQIEFLEYNVYNANIGSGIGYLQDNEMHFDYYNSVVNMNAEISFTTKNNGQTWEGWITFPANGASNNVALRRN